jgi:hypothetical protein
MILCRSDPWFSASLDALLGGTPTETGVIIFHTNVVPGPAQAEFRILGVDILFQNDSIQEENPSVDRKM